MGLRCFVLRLTLLLAGCLACAGAAIASDAPAWKYDYLAIVVQHSGTHMRTGPVFAEVLSRLASQKPPAATVVMIGFEREFKQLDDGHFSRAVRELLAPTSDADELRDTARDLVFEGPSPVFDAVEMALKLVAGKPRAAVLFMSNGIDNASDHTFEELLPDVEKMKAPIISFYFPTTPAMGGEGRMKKLAKLTEGEFVDLRTKDAWERLLAALAK